MLEKVISTLSMDMTDVLMHPLQYEDFLMPSAAVSANRVNTGTCPHGMSPGACPICSGMTGGNSTTKRDVPRNPGEMTYNQCAAIGAMLRAQRHAREQAELAQQNRVQALAAFQKNISAVHSRLVELQVFFNESSPAIIVKPLSFILNNTVIKLLNFVQNVPQNFLTLIQNVTQKFSEITDKLAAIYGELKASISDKFSKVFNNIKKKLKKLFLVFGMDETDNEEQKIEETKRVFELKTLLEKITGKLKEGGTDEH